MMDDVIYFFSPTHVWSDSNYLYCERGWYKVKEKIASLTDNAFIQTKEQTMYGDSIYYEMDVDFGMAFENVIVIDTVHDIIVHSDFALNNRKNGYAWFTKNAVGIVISDNDSLFLRGDTLWIAYDTSTNDVHHMLAYYNVQFFRHDMQGACDSMSYVMADSMMTMFGNPIAWANNDQLTGDTIRVLLSENKPKNMYLLNRAFMISKGYHTGHFNQVKGKEVIGFFNDSSELERINVFEKVETIYFVTDDADSSLIGIIKGTSEEMEIIFENRAVVGIRYFNPNDGAMFPDAELPAEGRFLRGFLWLDERRPKSKFDIWPNAPNSANDADFEELIKSLERDFQEQMKSSETELQNVNFR
jgi:lipopolysaccharide export system protein LptA